MFQHGCLIALLGADGALLVLRRNGSHVLSAVEKPACAWPASHTIGVRHPSRPLNSGQNWMRRGPANPRTRCRLGEAEFFALIDADGPALCHQQCRKDLSKASLSSTCSPQRLTCARHHGWRMPSSPPSGALSQNPPAHRRRAAGSARRAPRIRSVAHLHLVIAGRILTDDLQTAWLSPTSPTAAISGNSSSTARKRFRKRCFSGRFLS